MAKKKRPPRGRPRLPDGESKASVITVRLQPAEREILEAAKGSQTLSDWIRSMLLAAANGVKLEKSEAEGVGFQPHR